MKHDAPPAADLVRIYQCLCDRTRLRILNLLATGELCVCHLQAVLGEPQVKVSKHLAYLRRNGLVEARRSGSWMVYGIPDEPSPEISANLACLQDCARETPVFARDSSRLGQLRSSFDRQGPSCCAPASVVRAGRRRAPKKA
jgi:ArsR family transcriptional regulator